MHINQQPHTYPENFRALALTVLAGEATQTKKTKKTTKAVRLELGHYVVVGRVKTQGSSSSTGPLFLSIVGTVKTKKI